jgi:hypothetical protein
MNAVARPIVSRRIRQQALSRYEYYGPTGYGTVEQPGVPVVPIEVRLPAGRGQAASGWPRRGDPWSARARSLLCALFFALLLVVGAMVANDLVATETPDIRLHPVDQWAGVPRLSPEHLATDAPSATRGVRAAGRADL